MLRVVGELWFSGTESATDLAGPRVSVCLKDQSVPFGLGSDGNKTNCSKCSSCLRWTFSKTNANPHSSLPSGVIFIAEFSYCCFLLAWRKKKQAIMNLGGTFFKLIANDSAAAKTVTLQGTTGGFNNSLTFWEKQYCKGKIVNAPMLLN